MYKMGDYYVHEINRPEWDLNSYYFASDHTPIWLNNIAMKMKSYIVMKAEEHNTNKQINRAMQTILYLAMYNPMIYESSFGLISIHKTRKGAEMAMEFHKAEAYKEWEETYTTKEEQKEFPFGSFESWKVFEHELLD